MIISQSELCVYEISPFRDCLHKVKKKNESVRVSTGESNPALMSFNSRIYMKFGTGRCELDKPNYGLQRPNITHHVMESYLQLLLLLHIKSTYKKPVGSSLHKQLPVRTIKTWLMNY
jgi:hypothetical protein